MVANIPTVDFAQYDKTAPATVAELAAAVDSALASTGFLALANAGIEAQLRDEVFAASRGFFHGDPASKQRSAYLSASENFGYQGVGEEHLDPTAPADIKETFTMRNLVNRPPGDSRWPSAGFRDLMCRFYGESLQAAFRLMHVLTVALDVPPDFFARCHSGENVTLRLLHYPTGGIDTVAARQLGAGAHTDYGLLTLLFQDGTPGLEVEDAAGNWRMVAAEPDTVIVNSGDLLEVWTNGRYRSTPHRVQPRIGATERQSIAMFVDPDSATRVDTLASCTDANNPPRFAPTSAGAHLQERIEASHKARFAP